MTDKRFLFLLRGLVLRNITLRILRNSNDVQIIQSPLLRRETKNYGMSNWSFQIVGQLFSKCPSNTSSKIVDRTTVILSFPYTLRLLTNFEAAFSSRIPFSHMISTCGEVSNDAWFFFFLILYTCLLVTKYHVRIMIKKKKNKKQKWKENLSYRFVWLSKASWKETSYRWLSASFFLLVEKNSLHSLKINTYVNETWKILSFKQFCVYRI